MPMYDYKCESCGHRFEELVFSNMVSDSVITCPICGGLKAKRQLSAPAVAVGSSFEPACVKPGCATPANAGFS
ncbi:zinc ribbon domain-containing protein [Caldithrix abyssi]|nr:zinc ribbon domain-containing protein [Caldithrix abyssi]